MFSILRATPTIRLAILILIITMFLGSFSFCNLVWRFGPLVIYFCAGRFRLNLLFDLAKLFDKEWIALLHRI